mmetsp:Transcript_6124/g.9276  ORF Transcript_6124/g.9276 Transcript_6124/m.9276 type:complete len:216 (+) Transcript_6124:459-1106(+)
MNNLIMPHDTRLHKCCNTILITKINISPGLDKKFNNFQMSRTSGGNQSGQIIPIPLIDINLLFPILALEKRLNEFLISVTRGSNEPGPIRTHGGDICRGSELQLERGIVDIITVTGCHLHLFGILFSHDADFGGSLSFSEDVSGFCISEDVPVFGPAVCAFCEFDFLHFERIFFATGGFGDADSIVAVATAGTRGGFFKWSFVDLVLAGSSNYVE